MERKEIIAKDIGLTFNFLRYLIEHPDEIEKMPDNSELILLPEDDPTLCETNLNNARSTKEKGEDTPIAVFKVEHTFKKEPVVI